MFARALRRMSNFVSRTIAAISMLAVVTGVGLAHLLLSGPDSSYTGTRVEIRHAGGLDSKAGLSDALAVLRSTTAIAGEARTNRSELPYWLLADVPIPRDGDARSVHLPSRHAQSVRIWLLDEDGEVLITGSAVRGSDSGDIKARRAGFSFDIPTFSRAVTVVARIESTGPARLSVEIWKTADIVAASRQFDQSGGVLFGSLLMVAAFGTLTSMLTRDWVFFIFAAWTIASLRFASYSSGWDLAWLGLPTAEDYPRLVRNIPLAIYAVLTVALFHGIFKKDIARLRVGSHIRVFVVLAGALLLAAPVLPHQHFLPVLWLVSGPCLAYLMWTTLRIISGTGSSAAIWYCASWLTTLAGSVGEIAFASGIVPKMPVLINSLSGAVFSTLLAGISLAERINSERMRRVSAQTRAVEVLKRFQENYNSMPIGLFSLDSRGVIRLHNPSFMQMFALKREPDSEVELEIDYLLGEGTFSRLQDAAAHSSGNDIELHLPSDQGAGRWFLARVTRKGESIEGSVQDITTRKLAEGQLKHLVDHDHLTGLLNRRGLEGTLSRAISSVGEGGRCAIAYVDLDRFKLINDLHGHGTGDALIQQTARRLKSAVRARDHVARFADGFVVIFMDCPEHVVVGLTERIREVVGELPFEVNGKGLNMTVSVGVVSIDPSMSSVDAMAAADRACNEAKARGRNCVVRLTDKDAALRMHLEELKVVADLQKRVQTERYFLEFQPIVALQSAMASTSYEVLIRMRGEGGRVIPPGKFIGAAERNGLMSQIDRWVLRSTLEWLDDHPDHRDRLAFATINISGASLNDIRFVDDAFAMIAEHPLAMPKLCFEITESVALHDLGSTRRFFDRVRMYGSKLALDDFGAGYTSFNYLKEIPADFIKIDGSFVKEINRNPANYAITRMIVDLTHELGMRSIAEWAETPDTIASLIQLGVDYGQGFGLARPMAPEIVTAATSGGALVNDPLVLTLLQDGTAGAAIGAATGQGRRRQIAR